MVFPYEAVDGMILLRPGTVWRRQGVGPRRGGPLAREGKPRENDPALTILDPEDPRSAFTATRGSLRTEKITRVREQIRQGTYHITAAEVAKAILQSDPSRLLPKKEKNDISLRKPFSRGWRSLWLSLRKTVEER